MNQQAPGDNNKPDFLWRRLQDMSGLEVHEILQARESVFIVEQNCAYQDADKYDLHAWHLTGRVDGQLACYARVVDPGQKFSEPSIGRVLTAQTFRNSGLGRPLLLEAIQQVQMLYPGQNIRISAQAHLHKFYHSVGFGQVSEPYLEDGIAHIDMLWILPKTD